MPTRSFAAAATLAESTGLPVARGLAVEVEGKKALTRLQRLLPGWSITPLGRESRWVTATPPPDVELPLARAWALVRASTRIDGVTDAEPLLHIAHPAPRSARAAEAFAMNAGIALGPEMLGLWGKGYDDKTETEIKRVRRARDWHLTHLKMPEALARWTAKRGDTLPGDGMLIGHPDTGWTSHADIDSRWLKPGLSFIEDRNNAEDDRRPSDFGVPEQPGHGTSTGSVIAGPRGEAGGVWGVAPGARILPLRVSRSVIHFDFAAVAEAIQYAADHGAHVVSMSLGGPFYSRLVRAAIANAHANGVIVVSAAGNYFPSVVFPAAFPEVVAVAATHAAGEPWRFSGLGEVVDIAAPGEDVWVARWTLIDGAEAQTQGLGTGTSHATACTAGLAAMWLSYHGLDTLAAHFEGDRSLIPVAFQLLLGETADTNHKFAGEGTHGAGLANADALLAADLPSADAVRAFRKRLEDQSVHRASVFSRVIGGLLSVDGQPPATTAVEAALIDQLLGPESAEFADELLALLAADVIASKQIQSWQAGGSLGNVIDRLLDRHAAGNAMSPELRQALTRSAAAARPASSARGTLPPPDRGRQDQKPRDRAEAKRDAAEVARSMLGDGTPPVRILRAFSFDPSLATRLKTAPIFQVGIPVRWEALEPGPVGEYLEVVDIDPASGCLYAPVDLDQPRILAQDGLPPSEGNPQFHQQMVYAVAMNTINHFELALGRPIFWSPVRPWLQDDPGERGRWTEEAIESVRVQVNAGAELSELNRRDRYVQRLRVYPHALRQANAYYSPGKRALLFGYFPAVDDGSGEVYPGGTVFTCLSHDIVAHETTHALLDGMHPYFNVPTNEDVPAFHEAFADVIALFQHFSYPDVLRHQIAATRGDLQTDNLLAQLAQELGVATGRRQALRNALGYVENGTFHRHAPNPAALDSTFEPHDRGSILVAAIFDAFLALYDARVADLIRIATSGTGVLPTGRLHPDLVNRLADEAALTANEVLQICIRSLDYVPPVDITFGEFLRAVITADYELSPGLRHERRIAIIESFRRWGIYPKDVQMLSEESLRWRRPVETDLLFTLRTVLRLAERHAIARPGDSLKDALRSAGIKLPDRDGEQWLTELAGFAEKLHVVRLAKALQTWQPGADRAFVFQEMLNAQALLNELLKMLVKAYPNDELFPGMDRKKRFSISNLRPARRIGPHGEYSVEMVLEIVQSKRATEQDDEPDDAFRFRGGATMIIDMRNWVVKYVIFKRLLPSATARTGASGRSAREQRQIRYLERRGLIGARDTADDDGPRSSWTDAAGACRERRGKRALREPFAMIHQGEL